LNRIGNENVVPESCYVIADETTWHLDSCDEISFKKDTCVMPDVCLWPTE
jgi:hypothetical protein